MAISSYPTPAEAGILCLIIANMAMSISAVKELVCSILTTIGIHMSSCDELSVESLDPSECRMSPSESYMDDFRRQILTVRYDSVFPCGPEGQECSICLSEFDRSAEVNRLSCGHVFHRPCLEKWLRCWRMTCPLCRNSMMPVEEEADACPMCWCYASSCSDGFGSTDLYVLLGIYVYCESLMEPYFDAIITIVLIAFIMP
ncbi:RING-H2 zinc finger protein [Striga asiatica]|uniref:RING-H2 zinc finger protein n=1 Tax=Striga asiatica TaxID=4170 RepID=A0A5A7PL15_STRAF|nr:RING-H2 zinc finger protein [Striga asiatica]